MCYAKPGPRCSSHAKQNYLDAKGLVDSLNESNEPLDTPTYKRANAKLSRAKIDYLETPEGIRLLRRKGRHKEAQIHEDIRAKSIQKLKKINSQAKENEAHQGVEGFKEYIQAPKPARPAPKRVGNNPFSPAHMASQPKRRPTPHNNQHRPRVNAVAHLAKLTPDMVKNEAASYGASRNNRNATMTANQAKKHRNHMTPQELQALGKSLNIIGKSNTEIPFTRHAQEREDFQATSSEVKELLSRPDIQDRIIEYNVTKHTGRDGKLSMSRRVLVRDDRPVEREYTIKGGKEWRTGESNACYSISLETQQVITVYYNAANDHHNIDESRYSPDLKIL